MARKSKVKMTQINLTLPELWKTQLENLARIYSVELNHTISLQELMRMGLQEKFQLGGSVDEQYTEYTAEETESDE